jgi:hypothetical protein
MAVYDVRASPDTGRSGFHTHHHLLMNSPLGTPLDPNHWWTIPTLMDNVCHQVYQATYTWDSQIPSRWTTHPALGPSPTANVPVHASTVTLPVLFRQGLLRQVHQYPRLSETHCYRQMIRAMLLHNPE